MECSKQPPTHSRRSIHQKMMMICNIYINKYHIPFMPTGAFNICCPRDCVSRHNGVPRVPPLNPSETIELFCFLPIYAIDERTGYVGKLSNIGKVQSAPIAVPRWFVCLDAPQRHLSTPQGDSYPVHALSSDLLEGCCV